MGSMETPFCHTDIQADPGTYSPIGANYSSKLYIARASVNATHKIEVQKSMFVPRPFRITLVVSELKLLYSRQSKEAWPHRMKAWPHKIFSALWARANLEPPFQIPRSATAAETYIQLYMHYIFIGINILTSRRLFSFATL